MQKSLIVGCLLSVCALSGFAQSPAQVEGAKIVAERDAAYAMAHPTPHVNAMKPTTHHAGKRHAHPMVKKATEKVVQKKPAV
ncbi:MAG: hypothetical protein ABI434_15105 [Burkholderiaceae bacterium]